MGNFIQQLSIWAMPVLVAIILHEISHGYVARHFGDRTAEQMGRLTLNPVPHIDPIGTVALPAFLLLIGSPFVFGWAKPVPVHFANLRNPKRDMIWVAAAGPLTNLCLALISAFGLHLILGLQIAEGSAAATVLLPVLLMLQASVVINIVLAVFNLLPILPLDGGRVLTGLLPYRHAVAFSRLEPYGILIVMLLLATNALGQVIGPVIHAFLRVLL